MSALRPLSTRPLNDNYTPARPWRCCVLTAHACGAVVGFLGATPVCESGAAVEAAARAADRARIEALMDTPEMRAEAAREHAWESRVS